jgi:hypothetical protein
MLTGRAAQIHTIRTYKGLNGFLLRSESEHDSYGAGHAGTALSAALGMAAARDLAGGDNHIVAVAGDAVGDRDRFLDRLGQQRALVDGLHAPGPSRQVPRVQQEVRGHQGDEG